MAQNNQLVPVQLFSPDYYRTLVVRLYNFNGKAVAEPKPMVVIYETVKTNTGIEVRQITDAKEFTTYQEALDYIAGQGASASCALVGTDPFISPIPLEAVANYKEIYSSAASNNSTQLEKIIKIFKYADDK
jgi:hypothetical protein